MAVKTANNAQSKLASGIGTTDTSIAVQGGDGAKFPQISGSDWFPVTVVSAADPTQFEIMKCTAISSDTLTVERAKEDTTARSFVTGDLVEHRITAATFNDVDTRISAAQSTANSAQTTANAALPKLNGLATKLRYSVAAATASLDMDNALVFKVDLSTNRTLTLANVPADATSVVVQISGSAGTLTWGDTISWDGGAEPELGTNWTTVLLLRDGTTWFGFLGGSA